MPRLLGLVDEVVGDAAAGEGDDALGEQSEEFIVAPEGSGPSVCVPVGLADDLVDAVALRPSRRYLLGARTAAVDEDDVCVLGLELVEVSDDGACVVRLLAARDGHECPLRKMRGVLAVLSRPLEVARVDHGRCELAGLRDVGASPGSPDLAGLYAISLGGRVAQSFEGVSAVGEILRPVGLEFEFAGADLGAVLFALQFTDTGDEPVGGAVEALCLCVEGVDEAPQEVRSFVGELCAVGCGLCEEVEGLDDGGGGFLLVPYDAGVELIGSRSRAEELRLLADHGGEGFILCFVLCVLVHDALLVIVCRGGSHRSLLSLSSSEGIVVLGQRVAEIVSLHFFGHVAEVVGCPRGGACEDVAVAWKGMAVAAELAAVKVGEFVEVDLLLLDFFPEPLPVFFNHGGAVAVLADPEGVSPLRRPVDFDETATSELGRNIVVQVHHGGFHAFLLSRELTDAFLSAPFSARKGIGWCFRCP